MVTSSIYYAVIAGLTKTVRANNKEMAHNYFKLYDKSIDINNIQRLPVNNNLLKNQPRKEESTP